jgi:hypothetical protein
MLAIVVTLELFVAISEEFQEPKRHLIVEGVPSNFLGSSSSTSCQVVNGGFESSRYFVGKRTIH